MTQPSADPDTDLDVEFLIVTGMSGAGRSTVGHVLEDLGWFVVDNLPPPLLVDLVDLAHRVSRRPGRRHQRVAAIVDVRAREFSDSLSGAIDRLRQSGRTPTVIFLDATDEALVRRFESVRRPHPLQGQGRLLDGIQAERQLLGELRSSASVLIDTSGLNVHQLTRKITPLFSQIEQRTRLAVVSFGFKYGVPLDADFVFDMRFLPNPFWVPELRSLTGTDAPVSEFVFSQPGAEEFVDRVAALMETVAAGYEREGRRYVTLAVGCTGGKHRSVAVAEALGRRLEGDAFATFVVHRDLGRE
ncbi:MAG: RNase adapter RapZ [Actinobacteria bacterium]|nr:RNase adapter RapZ [Actinomycetota bacterium]